MVHAEDTAEFQTRMRRLEELLQEVERRRVARRARGHPELVQTLLDLTAPGWRRSWMALPPPESRGKPSSTRWRADDLVGSLLLLHGLHPLDLETRVRQALDQVRPALRGHGGDVELLEVRDGVVRLRLQGNCHGCPSSAATMRQTVEEAIVGKCPMRSRCKSREWWRRECKQTGEQPSLCRWCELQRNVTKRTGVSHVPRRSVSRSARAYAGHAEG